MAYSTIDASTGTDTIQPWDGGAVAVTAVPFSYSAVDDPLAVSYEAKILGLPENAMLMAVSIMIDVPEGADTIDLYMDSGAVTTITTGILTTTASVGDVQTVAQAATKWVVPASGGIWLRGSAALSTVELRGKAFVMYPNLS